jgi:hypothetical protein
MKYVWGEFNAYYQEKTKKQTHCIAYQMPEPTFEEYRANLKSVIMMQGTSKQ